MTVLPTAMQSLLRDAADDGWTYCGTHDQFGVAVSAERLGYGEIGETDLGPVFCITDAGRSALNKVDSENG